MRFVCVLTCSLIKSHASKSVCSPMKREIRLSESRIVVNTWSEHSVLSLSFGPELISSFESKLSWFSIHSSSSTLEQK